MGPRACHRSSEKLRLVYQAYVDEGTQDYRITLISLPEGTAARTKARVQQVPSRGPGWTLYE